MKRKWQIDTCILTGIVIFKFVMQYFLINPAYELQRDEYLHLDQAHHLAWGYESVPPFTSCISYIILQLGNTIYWVKFFPALFGALTIIIVWKAVEALGGNRFALLMGAVAISFSVLPRINILYQPNSFDILSWTAFLFCVINYIKTTENKWLYFAAIVFSLGFLNKYNIVFLLAGLAPAVLITPHRKLLVNKHFYFATLLSVLLILPNLLWQYQNNFPVIHHMKELAATQLVHVKRSDFLKEQLFFFLNSIFLILIAFLSFFIYPAFKKYRLLFWSFICTLLVFIYLKAKGYYAIGLYPVLLAFGAVYLEYLTSHGWKKWIRPVALVIPIILFAVVVKEKFPLLPPGQIVENTKKTSLHEWEDGTKHAMSQDFADMLGWKELAAKTDSIYNGLSDKEHTMIICDNYGQAGAINYYSKLQLKAVSLNADYINWFDFSRPILQVISIKEKENLELSIEKKIFDSIKPVGSIQNMYARENGSGIFILSNPKMDLNKLLKREIKKIKNTED